MSTKTAILLVLSFIPAIVAACSSEDAAAPSRAPIPPPSSTATSDGGGGGPDGSPGKDCFDTTTAKPTTPTDFLNQCTAGECFKFENGSRIEGWTPGGPLPPLN